MKIIPSVLTKPLKKLLSVTLLEFEERDKSAAGDDDPGTDNVMDAGGDAQAGFTWSDGTFFPSPLKNIMKGRDIEEFL